MALLHQQLQPYGGGTVKTRPFGMVSGNDALAFGRACHIVPPVFFLHLAM